jgi:hypothetical protein
LSKNWDRRARIRRITLLVGEILKESGIAKGKILDELLVEADELVAFITTIGKRSK